VVRGMSSDDMPLGTLDGLRGISEVVLAEKAML
jgi:hypothetical protein